MTHEKKGYPPDGVWMVKLNKKVKIFESTGGHYLELDALYITKFSVRSPKGWNDYTNKINFKKRDRFLKQFRQINLWTKMILE